MKHSKAKQIRMMNIKFFDSNHFGYRQVTKRNKEKKKYDFNYLFELKFRVKIC
jgi:hypothetical protein